jgi:hypothetical protein
MSLSAVVVGLNGKPPGPLAGFLPVMELAWSLLQFALPNRLLPANSVPLALPHWRMSSRSPSSVG